MLIDQLLVATGNAKKAGEIFALLRPLGFEALSLADVGQVVMPEETGQTFAENAAIKACAAARQSGLWSLADDSGLEVGVLQGAPGVYSARYSGEDASDADNNDKLLSQLSGIPAHQRSARFVCHLALADRDGEVRLQVNGACRGWILEDFRGREGFGYDPLFWVAEYHRTFAELSLTAKSVLSHRARAFSRLLIELRCLS